MICWHRENLCVIPFSITCKRLLVLWCLTCVLNIANLNEITEFKEKWDLHWWYCGEYRGHPKKMRHTWGLCSFVNFTSWSTVLTSYGSKLYHFTLSTQFSFINSLILMIIVKRITQASFVFFCLCCVSFISIIFLLLSHDLTFFKWFPN